MATPVVVNGDTTLVLINSKDLTANQSAVVLLSSIQAPGRTVTIRDSVGFLSTPQSIIVSTMAGVRFADGTSSIAFTQPYGYLSLSSRDASSWNLTNTFGFPQNQTVASVNSLTTSSVTAKDMYIQSTLSTNAIVAQTLTLTSTSAFLGAGYLSTLVVGPPPFLYNPTVTDPGYIAYIQGNTRILSNLDVDGAGRFGGQISTGSNLIVAGGISTQGSFGARGDIQTIGSIFAPFGGLFSSNLDVRGGATIGGVATFSNSLFITSSLAAQTSISTNILTTSTLSIDGQLSMQGKTLTYRTYDLLFSDPITVPSISTNYITASNSINTSNLTVTTSISAESTAYLTLSSAVITNPHGSLSLSSLTANTAAISDQISTQQFQTSSIWGSTLYLTGNIDAPAAGYLNINSAVISSISTNTLGAGAVITRTMSTAGVNVQFLNITSSFIGNNLSSCFMSNVNVVNTGGSLETNSLTTRNVLIASTMSNTSGFLTAPTSALRIAASNVVMSAAAISSIAASTITTSTLTATRLTMGAPPTIIANGPNFQPETTYPSTNVTITGGPGDYLSPYFLSNVKPPGINTGDPYTVEASFFLNFNGPILPGYYASILGLNLYPNGELNSQISIRTYNDTNTLVTLYGLYGTDQSYSTPPGTGGIPVPAPPLPSSFIHVVGTMYGNSAFNLQFQSRFNDNFTSIDSNNVITMNNGVLRWPYFLNGTTIQNSLNDISVRNIYYYGGLNFASDPALKENIELADLSHCSQIIQSIPLKRYKYIDSYLSTFQVKDAHRIGVLATDLEQVFPKSITYTTLEGVAAGSGAASTFRVIDTQQLEMAHLGTTQHLMGRLQALSTTVKTMVDEITQLKSKLV